MAIIIPMSDQSSEPTNAALARRYGVECSQIRRWKERGLPLNDPAALVAELAKQDRPGKVFRQLSRPEVLASSLAAFTRGLQS